MIFGSIHNMEQEKTIYPAILQQGLEYLRKTDCSKLPVGKEVIDGDNLYAIVSEYAPDAKENRKAEAHAKYADIQFIVSGEEYIGYCPLSDGVEVLEDKLAEKDAIFYKQVNNEQEIKLTPGTFAVFFPWDIHRPGCVSQPGGQVRKVVVKVKMSEMLK